MPDILKPPLTPAVFFTLFALSRGEKHGYAIMLEAQELSDGSFRMGPATLYTTLQRLLDLDLVAEAGSDPADSRRRNYRLTKPGRALLDAELERIEALILKAKAVHRKPAPVKL